MNRLLLVCIAVLFIQSHSQATKNGMGSDTPMTEGGSNMRRTTQTAPAQNQRATTQSSSYESRSPNAEARESSNATRKQQAQSQSQGATRATKMVDPVEEMAQGNSRILMMVRKYLGYDAYVAIFHLTSNVPVPFPGLKLTVIPDDDEEECMMKDETMKGMMKGEMGDKMGEMAEEMEKKENWTEDMKEREKEEKIVTQEKEGDALADNVTVGEYDTMNKTKSEGADKDKMMDMDKKKMMAMGIKTFGILSLDDMSDVVQSSNLMELGNKMEDGMIRIDPSPRAIVGVLVITAKPTTFGIPMPCDDYERLAKLLDMKYDKAMEMEEKIQGAACKARRLMKAQMMAEEMAAMEMEEKDMEMDGEEEEMSEEMEQDKKGYRANRTKGMEEEKKEMYTEVDITDAKREGKIRPQEKELDQTRPLSSEEFPLREIGEGIEKLEDLSELEKDIAAEKDEVYMTTMTGGGMKREEKEEAEEETTGKKYKKGSFVGMKAMMKEKKTTLKLRRARNILEDAYVAMVEKCAPSLVEKMIYRLTEGEGSCMDADKEKGDEEALDQDPLDEEEDMDEEARFMPDMSQVMEIAKMSTAIWSTAGIEVIQMTQMMNRAERMAKMQRANAMRKMMKGEDVREMQGKGMMGQMMDKAEEKKEGKYNEMKGGQGYGMEKKGGQGYGMEKKEDGMGMNGGMNWSAGEQPRAMAQQMRSAASYEMKKTMFRFRKDAMNKFLSGEEEEEEMEEDMMDKKDGYCQMNKGDANGDMGSGMGDGYDKPMSEDMKEPMSDDMSKPGNKGPMDNDDKPMAYTDMPEESDKKEMFDNLGHLADRLKEESTFDDLEHIVESAIEHMGGVDADKEAVNACMECDGCGCDGCVQTTPRALFKTIGINGIKQIASADLFDDPNEKICVPDFFDGKL